MSESVVAREEVEEMMWALADIRVDVLAIREFLMRDDEEEAEEDEP